MTRATYAGVSLTVLLASTATVGAAPKKTPRPNDNALVACENTAPRPGNPRFCTAPVLEVGSSGLSAGRAAVLREALDLPGGETLDSDGALRFMDVDRFQRVPTLELPAPDVQLEPGEEQSATGFGTERHVLDVTALNELTPLPPQAAVQRISDALRSAQLLPQTAGTPRTDHATFELFANPDYAGGAAHTAGAEAPGELPTIPLLETIVGKTFQIDTQVSYPLAVDGVPVIGPGAKVKASFDPQGKVSQLLYSAVDIVGKGQRVPVTPPELALDLCAAALDTPASVTATAELVYYAPALAHGVTSLLPHYSCGGSGVGHDGEEVLQRNVLIPAVVDAPAASVQATTSGAYVSASVAVSGGTAPYTYSWSSQNTQLDPAGAQGSSVAYTVTPRSGASRPGPLAEELLVTVTDANGLVAVGRADLQVTPGGSAPAGEPGSAAGGTAAASMAVAASHGGGGIETGVEWVGTFSHAGDLPGVPQNAQGFAQNTSSASGVTNRFIWGNNDAFETDFKASSKGGQDSAWVDDVDMAFFTGHAGGTGWNLESAAHDNFVSNTDTLLGDTDLEWLVIGACGVLQDGFEARWGSTFKGLHMILGYATVSNDTTQEGSRFTAAAYGLGQSPRYLYQAWGQQAIDIQPSTVRYGYAGPVGYNGEWNAYDYFWGRGTVTADITNVYYLWRTTGNA